MANMTQGKTKVSCTPKIKVNKGKIKKLCFKGEDIFLVNRYGLRYHQEKNRTPTIPISEVAPMRPRP
jgi:hypothetical protein